MAKNNNRTYGGDKVYACPQHFIILSKSIADYARKNKNEAVNCDKDCAFTWKTILKFDSTSEYWRFLHIKKNISSGVELHKRISIVPPVKIGQAWSDRQFSSLEVEDKVFYPERFYKPDFVYEFNGIMVAEEHKGSSKRDGTPYIRGKLGDLMLNFLGLLVSGYLPIVSSKGGIYVADSKFKKLVRLSGGMDEIWRHYNGN